MASSLFAGRRVLWLPLDYDWQPPSAAVRHCCETMAMSLELSCDLHSDPFECPDVPLVFHEIFGEYGIPIRDGGPGYLLIDHCPWCGGKLPEGARDRWFDTIDAGGLGDTPTALLPERLRTAAWREQANS
ncbi:MAG: hypothetical protein R3D44_07035 [Hyphomicrobiaceae bacterium]